ncbi:MAG: PD40 domain-containing protein [Actinobacteria bacterium]|nr:PD40 domain-containing protein [Actinomycetota bacterium]
MLPIAILVLLAFVGAVALIGRAGASRAEESPAGLIAFHADPNGDSGLYVMNANGKGVRLASPNLAGDPFSKWSADGSRLAFLSGSFGAGSLRVLNLSKGREQRIGTRTVRAFDWSPDGTRLVYEATDRRIWIAAANGTGRAMQIGKGHAPVWSPDGKWIAYFDGPEENSDVFKVSARGSRPMRLTHSRSPDYSPQWSPKGSQIAFISERNGNTELYLVRSNGSGLRRLTHDSAPDEDFEWDRSGTQLVYVSYRDGADPLSIGIGNAEVQSVEVRTGIIHDLSNNPAWDGDPAWSPDGRWIAFTRRTSHGVVAVMRSDGSEQTILDGAVGAPFNDCCPSWQPQH